MKLLAPCLGMALSLALAAPALAALLALSACGKKGAAPEAEPRTCCRSTRMPRVRTARGILCTASLPGW